MMENCCQSHSGNTTCVSVFQLRPVLADAFEYYYGDHRAEGQDLIREYCQMKTHLRVRIEHPKPDPELEAHQQTLSRVSIPSVFLSGE